MRECLLGQQRATQMLAKPKRKPLLEGTPLLLATQSAHIHPFITQLSGFRECLMQHASALHLLLFLFQPVGRDNKGRKYFPLQFQPVLGYKRLLAGARS